MLCQRRDEKPVMDLRRLCCAGLCACGAALVVMVVPSLRFILASQAGLVIGWRIAAMPPSMLAQAASAAFSSGALKEPGPAACKGRAGQVTFSLKPPQPCLA